MPHDPRSTSTDSAVADLLGGKPAKAKAKGKSKLRAEVEAPDDLKAAVDVMVAGRQFQKTIESKIKTAEARVKTFTREHWCELFSATGIKPEMFHVLGDEGQFSYSQTKRIHLNQEKLEALQMLGIDITAFVETTGIKIDMQAVAALGYMEKLTEAIKSMVGDNPEHVSQIFRPEVSVKDGILEALPNIVGDSLQDDEKLDAKMITALDTLGAVDQIRSPKIDKTSTECFEIVMGAKLDADKS
jgi:hypothetical protein